jgi:acetyl-CoA carboxylase carboxyltransferase component
MGLEGAVRLGFKKELEAIAEGAEREALFTQLVDEMYERGKATEAAAHLEIDAVIDPADTRGVIVRAFDSRVN